ncbi:hypothetical protein FXO38_02409, partial [Capsicum annuum]
MMSRLSFRPRPLDIHKRLPILKSLKDFEDDDGPSNTRNQIIRLAAEDPDIEGFYWCGVLILLAQVDNYILLL